VGRRVCVTLYERAFRKARASMGLTVVDEVRRPLQEILMQDEACAGDLQGSVFSAALYSVPENTTFGGQYTRLHSRSVALLTSSQRDAAAAGSISTTLGEEAHALTPTIFSRSASIVSVWAFAWRCLRRDAKARPGLWRFKTAGTPIEMAGFEGHLSYSLARPAATAAFTAA
jgi:hypothetical protein